jgi:parvulin-like peptidyl-prolyl isomerase
MMIFMRNHMKKFMWGTILVIVPSFILTFGYVGYEQRQQQAPAFTVNDVEFYEQELSNRAQRLRQDYRSRLGDRFDDSVFTDEKLRQQAFDDFVNEAVLRNEEKRLGLYTTDAEVSRNIQANEAFANPDTNVFDKQIYAQRLRQQGMWMTGFEEQVRMQITRSKLEDILRQAATVTDGELREAFKDRNEMVSVGFLRFDAKDKIEDITATASEVEAYYETYKEEYTKMPEVQVGYVAFNPMSFSASVKISTPELKAHYEQNAQQYIIPAKARAEYISFEADDFANLFVPSSTEVANYFQANKDNYAFQEMRRVRYVAIPLDPERKTLAVTDKMLQNYYDENISNYLKNPEQVSARHILIKVAEDAPEAQVEIARKKIEGILQEVKAGDKTFEDAAREHSEGPSGPRGGDLGSFGRGQMVPAFQDAAFAAAVDEVTGPIRSPFGLHLIQVYKHEQEERFPLEDIKDQIEKRLRDKAANIAVSAKADALAAKLGEKGLDPDAIGNEWKVVETKLFSRIERSIDDTIGEDIYLFTGPTFNLDLENDKVSKVVKGNSNYYFVELLEVQAARPMTLEEARDKVKADIASAQALSFAQIEADGALSDIRSGTGGWAAAAVAYATSHNTTRMFSAQDRLWELGAAQSDFKDAVLKASQGDVGGPILTDSAAIIYYVSEKTEERIPKFEEMASRVDREYRQLQRGEIAREAAVDLFKLVADELTPGALEEWTKKLIEEENLPIVYTLSDNFRREEPFDSAPELKTELDVLKDIGQTGYAVIYDRPQTQPGQPQPPEDSLPIRKIYVLQLLNAIPQRIPELAEVYDDVEKDYLLQKAYPLAVAAAGSTLADIQKHLTSGKGRNASDEIDLADFKLAEGLELTKTIPFRRFSIPSELGQFSLEFNRTAFGLKSGQMSGVVSIKKAIQPFWKSAEEREKSGYLDMRKQPEGAVIMYLVSRELPTDEEYAEQKGELYDELYFQNGRSIFNEWLRRKNKAAKIVIMRSNLRKLVAERDAANVKIDLYSNEKKMEEQRAKEEAAKKEKAS